MNSPWEVLGVQPGCSPSELKRAYALLLKQHRPDKDPEGFRLIRDAYEWMRENGAMFAAAVESPPESPTEPAPEPLATPAAEVSTAPPVPLEIVHEDVETDRDAAPPLNQQPLEIPISTTPVEIARRDWSADSAWFGEFARHGEWHVVSDRLNAMEAALKLDPSPEGAEAVLAGAKHIAVLDWKRAQQLVDAAFQHLSPYARNTAIEEVDLLIQVGKEVADIPYDARFTLAKCLINNSANPRDQAVLQAFQNLASRHGIPTAKAYFRDRFLDRFPKLAMRLRERPAIVARPAPVSSGSGFNGYWLIGVMVMAFLRGMNGCSAPSYSTPSYDRPTYYKPPDIKLPNTDEINRIMGEEFKRQQRERNEGLKNDDFSELLKRAQQGAENDSAPQPNSIDEILKRARERNGLDRSRKPEDDIIKRTNDTLFPKPQVPQEQIKKPDAP